MTRISCYIPCPPLLDQEVNLAFAPLEMAHTKVPGTTRPAFQSVISPASKAVKTAAANGIRVGTEVTTRTSGGEEWQLIYEYDQQGNLTNYVVNDSGDTIMFYEGTDINRSINVNNYPMQATVIQ